MSDNENHNPEAPQPVMEGVEPVAVEATEPLSAEGAEPVEETPPEAAEPDLAAQLAAAEKQRDDYLDQWRRSAADFQNFKKREEKMRAERERAANARLLTRLLPVMDDLQRGVKHVPEEISANDWVAGMLAIERKLWTILEQEGVSAIEAAPGSELDPTIHEALVAVPAEGVESGTIVDELERGYRLREMVLRPARVTVAQ